MYASCILSNILDYDLTKETPMGQRKRVDKSRRWYGAASASSFGSS